VALDLELDGEEGRVSCSGGEEACDVCHVGVARPASTEGEAEGSLRRRAVLTRFARAQAAVTASEEQHKLSQLVEILEALRAKGCIFCRAVGVTGQRYDPLWCTVPREYVGQRKELLCRVQDISRAASRAMKRVGCLDRFGSCWRCLMPQEICDAWVEDERQGGWHLVPDAECQFQSLALPALVRVFVKQQDSFWRIFSDLGFQGELWSQDMYRWLGARVSWAGTEVSMLSKVTQVILGSSTQETLS
jgi:hypothetical protein